MKTAIKIQPLFIALLFTLLCCKNKTNNYTDHLPPKVMEKVLLDISLAEAYSTMVKDSLHKAGPKHLDSLSVYYKDIFAHHHVTETQFTSSMNYYKNHPDDLDTIYNNIIPVAAKWQTKKP